MGDARPVRAAGDGRWILLVLVLLASLEAAAFYRIERGVLPWLVEAARGVVVGVPHWRVYQSRVLGPFAMATLAGAVHIGFARAFLIVMGLLVYLKDFALYGALRAWFGPGRSLALAALGSAAFLLAQDSWIYPWDLIDVAVSAGIVWLAAAPRPPLAVAALFAAALLNRESSAFLGLWLMIDAGLVPGCRGPLPLRPSLARPRQLLAGFGMIALTALVDELLRRALFVAAAMAPLQAGRGGPEFGGQFQLKLFYNLGQFVAAFRPDGSLVTLAADLFLATVLALFCSRVWASDPRLRKLALLALVEAAALPVFGIVPELRVFCGLIPFMVVLLAPPPGATTSRLAPAR